MSRIAGTSPSFGRPISATYEVRLIINNYYYGLNISNFSRRTTLDLGITLTSAMTSAAQFRINPNGLILVNNGLVLALVRAFTLLLLLGVGGTIGGAET